MAGVEGLPPVASLERRLVAALLDRGWTLACAESLTGGGFGERVTRVPGAGDVFRGGLIAYTDAAKTALLGVDADDLRRLGGVSEEVAVQMAAGARKSLDADVAVSLTGFAGPDAPKGMPVGLVFIGVARDGWLGAQAFQFKGDRASVREQAVEAALQAALVALDADASLDVS